VGHSLHRFANIVKQGLLYSGIILFSDAVGLGLDSLILGRNMFHYYTLFTLAQAALLFLVGGAVDEEKPEASGTDHRYRPEPRLHTAYYSRIPTGSASHNLSKV